MVRNNKPSSDSKRPAPAPARAASLGQTMKEGFGFGVGISVGRNIVDGMFNMFSTPKSSNPKEQNKLTEYEKCLEYSSNDIEKYKSLLHN
jgi:hypothetical protein